MPWSYSPPPSEFPRVHGHPGRRRIVVQFWVMFWSNLTTRPLHLLLLSGCFWLTWWTVWTSSHSAYQTRGTLKYVGCLWSEGPQTVGWEGVPDRLCNVRIYIVDTICSISRKYSKLISRHKLYIYIYIYIYLNTREWVNLKHTYIFSNIS